MTKFVRAVTVGLALSLTTLSFGAGNATDDFGHPRDRRPMPSPGRWSVDIDYAYAAQLAAQVSDEARRLAEFGGGRRHSGRLIGGAVGGLIGGLIGGIVDASRRPFDDGAALRLAARRLAYAADQLYFDLVSCRDQDGRSRFCSEDSLMERFIRVNGAFEELRSYAMPSEIFELDGLMSQLSEAMNYRR